MHQCFKAFRLLNRLPSLLFVLRQHPPRSPALVNDVGTSSSRLSRNPLPRDCNHWARSFAGSPLQRAAYETKCSCSLRNRVPKGRRVL